jgi:hypothetical protein
MQSSMYTMSLMNVSSSSFLVNMTGQVEHIVSPTETIKSLNSSYRYLSDSVMSYMASTCRNGFPQYSLNCGKTSQLTFGRVMKTLLLILARRKAPITSS